MSGITSTLRNEADERLFDSLRAASRRYPSVRAVPGEYLAEARRMGWSYGLIGSALQCSASAASRALAAHVARKFRP